MKTFLRAGIRVAAKIKEEKTTAAVLVMFYAIVCWILVFPAAHPIGETSRVAALAILLIVTLFVIKWIIKTAQEPEQ